MKNTILSLSNQLIALLSRGLDASSIYETTR